MTYKEKAQAWIKKHNIGGSKAWWDGKIYYNLTIEQIVSIAKYINKGGKNYR